MTDLPCHEMRIYYDLKRRGVAKITLEGLREKLAAGELRDLYVNSKDKDIDCRDNESDKSVGRPWNKKCRKPYKLSSSEEKMILNLPSCLLVHLSFHDPFNDDGWCY